MKSFANDPSLDRVLLISREEMGGAAGGFDPLHPVYTQTEGADPFTYRNDFCRMRLLADGTVELTEFGRPACFAEEWQRLLSQLAACRTLTDLRIYDYDGDEPPMAAALTTYGRLLLYGNAGEYAPAAGWQGVARVFWDTDGFGALCEDEMFRAVGALSALDGIGEIEEAVGSALPGHCSPVAYLLQKNGTVTLFDRKNRSIQRPRERVQKIALVRYNPYGVSTWVALSKITGRFLCSEPRDSISADFFGGDYTDIIAPNRFRQKIADFAAVPRRYLAVLYQNGYLRVFGSGYHSGDILCEDVRGIELEGEELIAYLPADLSYAPAIDLEEPEEGDTLSPAESIVTLGQPVDLSAILSLLRQRVEGWRRAEELAPPAAKKPVRAIRRSERYIYFLYRDGTVEAALLTHTGHSPHGENAVSHWKNVREVIPGRHQTLALCEDGSVLAAGRGYGQPYAVSAWKNVTQLYQSSGLAAAVTAAGIVYAQWADTNEPVQGTGGQHILNGPRLTTALGNHPACLSGKISQRNGEHCHPMHPAHPRQIFLIGKNKNCNEEKDEVSAQYHHYAKHIERKRHIGNQLVDILYITIAEIGHILLQHLSCHLRLGIVASGLCLTIVGESADSRFPFLDLLPGRKRGCAVFQRITAFQQVIDARHKSL